MLSGDELVTVISVKQKVGWQTFNHYLQVLAARLSTQIDNTKYFKTNIVRSLESLSFCDFDFHDPNSSWVYACKPACVRLPSTSAQEFLLVGARTSMSLEKLSSSFRSFEIEMLVDKQPYPLIPARILVRQDANSIKQVCDEQKIAFSLQPPSWELLCSTPSVREFIHKCEFVSILESHTPREDFNPHSLKFVNGTGKVAHGLCRLSTYFADYGWSRHKLWIGEKCADVDLDWGRYFVLADTKKSVLFYDVATCNLFIPVLAPLPNFYSRAMALCSGFAPNVVSPTFNSNLLCYQYKLVPHLLAKILAKKLDQRLIDIREKT